VQGEGYLDQGKRDLFKLTNRSMCLRIQTSWWSVEAGVEGLKIILKLDGLVEGGLKAWLMALSLQ
jgi:hypothetical protein